MTKRYFEIEKEAQEFGFEWPNIEMIFDQISNELQEVKETILNDESSSRIQEEIGDLLGSCMSLCIFLDFDIDETLDKLNEKFASRIESLKNVAANMGLNSLKDQSLDTYIELWHKVKRLEKS